MEKPNDVDPSFGHVRWQCLNLPSNLSRWLQETNRLVPPPPMVESGKDPSKAGAFHWASYLGKDPYPNRVVYQSRGLVERARHIDSAVPHVYTFEHCVCDTCPGQIEPRCARNDWKDVGTMKIWIHNPFEFGKFPDQPESRPSPFPWREGIENEVYDKGIFFVWSAIPKAGSARRSLGTITNSTRTSPCTRPSKILWGEIRQ